MTKSNQRTFPVARISTFGRAPRTRPSEILGYRNDEFFLLTASGIQKLCGDYGSSTVLKTLRARGLMRCETGKLTHKSPTLPDRRARINAYWISVGLVGELDLDRLYMDQGPERAKPIDGGPRAPLGAGDGVPF